MAPKQCMQRGAAHRHRLYLGVKMDQELLAVGAGPSSKRMEGSDHVVQTGGVCYQGRLRQSVSGLVPGTMEWGNARNLELFDIGIVGA